MPSASRFSGHLVLACPGPQSRCLRSPPLHISEGFSPESQAQIASTRCTLIPEILQWASLIIVSILLLGVMRQLSLLAPTSSRTADVLGPVIGSRLPRAAVMQLTESIERRHSATLLAFVTQDCAGCQRLLASLTRDEGRPHETDIAIVTRNANEEFRSAVDQIGLPVGHDDGALWVMCKVNATPFLILLDGDYRVLSRGVSHRVDNVSIAS
jgi:hypothetical protein